MLLLCSSQMVHIAINDYGNCTRQACLSQFAENYATCQYEVEKNRDKSTAKNSWTISFHKPVQLDYSYKIILNSYPGGLLGGVKKWYVIVARLSTTTEMWPSVLG